MTKTQHHNQDGRFIVYSIAAPMSSHITRSLCVLIRFIILSFSPDCHGENSFCNKATQKCDVQAANGETCDGGSIVGGHDCLSSFCDKSTYKCAVKGSSTTITKAVNYAPCTRSQDCISSYCEYTSSLPPQCKTSPPRAGLSAIDTPCDSGKSH